MTNVQAAMSEGTNMGKAYTDKNQAFVSAFRSIRTCRRAQ